jgi:type I restriction enzyme R subunit
MTDAAWQTLCWKRTFARLECWLDAQPAKRALEDPRLARVVVNAIHHFAGERYHLFAYVIMPSHVHWLFQPLPEWTQTLPHDKRSPRQRITYSMNRFTATQCNRLRNAKGKFWQTESYDHWVRDVDELERIMRYIEENPVKARLVETPQQWPFSSASVRAGAGLEWGVPLPKLRIG